MKKIVVCFVIILCTLLTLTACATGREPTPTAEEKLVDMVEQFADISQLSVSGRIYKDGALVTALDGVVDDTVKKIALNLNGDDLLYASKYLFRGKNGVNSVDRINTSYVATLDLLPFSLYHFDYNANYKLEILETDNTIVLTFNDKGVKNIFGSVLAVSGGVFSATHKNGRITDTVLTTTLTENKKEMTYSAHYSYKEGGTVPTALPVITPTDDFNYAFYALTAMSEKHGDDTLHVVSSQKDTEVKIGATVLDEKKIDKIFVIVLNDKSFNLNIVYKDKVIMVGISSAITEMQISYDKNYQVSSVLINKGTKYELK